MIRKFKRIMAIDPDVDESGVAIVDMTGRTLTTSRAGLPELVEMLRVHSLKMLPADDMVVVVEASWLAKANWHAHHTDSHRVAAAKGEQTGRNHEVGRQIVKFCGFFGIPYEEKLPLKKIWNGKDGKITFTELKSLCSGSGIAYDAKKNNQEERDAALLAIDRSGIPMIMDMRKR